MRRRSRGTHRGSGTKMVKFHTAPGHFLPLMHLVRKGEVDASSHSMISRELADFSEAQCPHVLQSRHAFLRVQTHSISAPVQDMVQTPATSSPFPSYASSWVTPKGPWISSRAQLLTTKTKSTSDHFHPSRRTYCQINYPELLDI